MKGTIFAAAAALSLLVGGVAMAEDFSLTPDNDISDSLSGTTDNGSDVNVTPDNDGSGSYSGTVDDDNGSHDAAMTPDGNGGTTGRLTEID